MAQTLRDDQERERRIILIVEHILKTGDSTRKTAQYFSENFFPISYVTVHDYCKRYIKKFPNRAGELLDVIENNTEKTISDDEVIKRIINVHKLFLVGKTVKEIADLTEIDYWTVYRDLTVRLRKLSEELYKNDIEPRLEENSMSTLRNVK